MQKLHMVGFTTDHRGLIFSVRRNAKSGGYVVNVDASIIEAIDELKASLAEEAAADSESDTTATRPQSALSVREIQARLRRGRTIEQVAREAGVEPSWISRFAVPVLAEQAEVIRAARATHMTKQRNNLSALPLGEAVYRNIAERGVTDPRDQLDKAWRARQLTEGMWLVTFAYTARGRENKAQWEYDETSRVVRARGRLGGSIGFRDGPRRLTSPAVHQAASGSPSRATTPRTAKKAATKRASAKKVATKRATAKKAITKKTTTKKATARKAPAKKTATANTPATARKTAATTKATGAPSTARQSSSRQATRRVATLRRAAAARLEAEAEKATRRDIAAVRKAAKRVVVVPPRLVPPPTLAGPLLVDDPAATEVEPDLDLQWDATPNGAELAPDVEGVAVDGEVEVEADVEVDVEIEMEVEPEVEPDAEPELEPQIEVWADSASESEPWLDAEPAPTGGAQRALGPEPEPEPEVRPEPAPQPNVQIPRPVRRQPLRGRPAAPPVGGNGPVFRSDLAPVAGDTPDVARSAVGQSADVPLSMPLDPIEPPPRRRRLRPLRGR